MNFLAYSTKLPYGYADIYIFYIAFAELGCISLYVTNLLYVSKPQYAVTTAFVHSIAAQLGVFRNFWFPESFPSVSMLIISVQDLPVASFLF